MTVAATAAVSAAEASRTGIKSAAVVTAIKTSCIRC